MAIHFKALTSLPVGSDTIELREPGAATKIAGQIKDLSGGNLANPFKVSDAGAEGDWDGGSRYQAG